MRKTSLANPIPIWRGAQRLLWFWTWREMNLACKGPLGEEPFTQMLTSVKRGSDVPVNWQPLLKPLEMIYLGHSSALPRFLCLMGTHAALFSMRSYTHGVYHSHFLLPATCIVGEFRTTTPQNPSTSMPVISVVFRVNRIKTYQHLPEIQALLSVGRGLCASLPRAFHGLHVIVHTDEVLDLCVCST